MISTQTNFNKFNTHGSVDDAVDGKHRGVFQSSSFDDEVDNNNFHCRAIDIPFSNRLMVMVFQLILRMTQSMVGWHVVLSSVACPNLLVSNYSMMPLMMMVMMPMVLPMVLSIVLLMILLMANKRAIPIFFFWMVR